MACSLAWRSPGWMKWSLIQYVYKQWAGLYQTEDQFLYVNRGLGFLGYPGRVGILPEITLLELTSKTPKQGYPELPDRDFYLRAMRMMRTPSLSALALGCSRWSPVQLIGRRTTVESLSPVDRRSRDLMTAYRNDRETQTLNGTFFSFSAGQSMATNLPLPATAHRKALPGEQVRTASGYY